MIAQTQTATLSFAFLRDVLALAKPRLLLLVLCTTAGGMWLAPGDLSAARGVITLLCTAGIVGAANALNCYLERDIDARMRRTRERPLAARRLEPRVAMLLGIAIPTVALPLLAYQANDLTSALAALAFFSYVLVYTPMKQWSPWAVVVGAVPGAIPPLLGWTSVTGRLDAAGLMLFAILFLWQLPHFLAISIYLKDDYARGGLKVFALVHGDRVTKLTAALASIVLVPVTMLLVPAGVAKPFYGASAAVLGSVLCAVSIAGFNPGAGIRWARNFFLTTLGYLTLLLVALFIGAR